MDELYNHEACLWLAAAIICQACNDLLKSDNLALPAFSFLNNGRCDVWLDRAGLDHHHLRRMLAEKRPRRITYQRGLK